MEPEVDRRDTTQRKMSGKKGKITLAVSDKFTSVAVRNAFPGVSCLTPESSVLATSLLRGVRGFYTKLIWVNLIELI